MPLVGALVVAALLAGPFGCQQASPVNQGPPAAQDGPGREQHGNELWKGAGSATATSTGSEIPPTAAPRATEPPRADEEGGRDPLPRVPAPSTIEKRAKPDDVAATREPRRDPVRAAVPSESVPSESSPPQRELPESGSSASGAREVEAYLDRVKSRDIKVANEAFRELWEVSARLIPALLRHIEDESPTSLTELTVIVFGSIGQQDVNSEQLVYYIPGLGGAKIDDIASGRVPRPGAFKVVLKRRAGFPLGVVVRAALLNRFRSAEYPPGDDRRDPSGWWYEYYENVRSGL